MTTHPIDPSKPRKGFVVRAYFSDRSTVVRFFTNRADADEYADNVKNAERTEITPL